MFEKIMFPSVWGATCRGPAHQKENKPNQDAILCRRFLRGGIVVVSDGLGSKKYSHIGSRMACKAVLIEVKIWLRASSQNLGELLPKIRRRWLSLCAPYGAEHCAATCLFCIMHNGMLHLARLGDGLIIALGQGSQELVLEDTKQENFTNITACLSSKTDYPWQSASIPAGEGASVFLCTDGISEDIHPGKKAEFAKGIIRHYSKIFFLARPYALQLMLKRWPAPLHSDDKSLAVLQTGGYNGL